MERTGSTRVQPRSLAGAGTTAPSSGHVCGRGVSQCHARRTRMTSSMARPATPPILVSGPSEYQANLVPLLDAAVDLRGRGLAVARGDVERHHRDLEILVLPEGGVEGSAGDRELDQHRVVAQARGRALLDRAAGGLDVLKVGVAEVEVLLVDLEVRGCRG